MVRGAQFVYRFDHDGDMVGIDQEMDTMPQVENMAAASAEIRQQGCHFLPDPGDRGIQHTGIEIALQCDLLTDPPAGST